MAALAQRLGLPAEVLARCYERVSTPVETVVDNGLKRQAKGGKFAGAVAEPAPELGAEPVLTWLPLDCMIVDKTYQREITADGWERVNRIVREFRWSKFQPITVAGRDPEAGTFAVIDGQHRVEACRRHPQIRKVPCYVIGGGEPALEAMSFVALNRDRIALSTVNVFWAQLAAGDRQAKAAQRICAAAGVSIARGQQGRLPPLTLSAVRVLYDLMALDEDAAAMTVATIARAKPKTPAAFQARVLWALGELILGLEDDLAPERLEQGLAGLDFGWATAQAALDAKVTGGSKRTCLGVILLDAYDGKMPGPVAPGGRR